MTAPILEVRDLCVDIALDGARGRLLHEVGATVRPGAIVGVIGESGSGKTSFALALLGILPSSASIRRGSVMLERRDLLRVPDAELVRHVRGKQIAYVPQDPASALDPLFTIGRQVKDVLAAGLGARRARNEWRSRAEHYLRAVHISDPDGMLRRRPAEVSGGQRQRLMVAMALMLEPKVVIADEPTTALDVTIQARILKLLRMLADEKGVGMILTTHDLGVAHEICDHVAVMYAGEIVESAPTGPLLSAPRHPYTRKLLEARPKPGQVPAAIPGEVSPPTVIHPGCAFEGRCDRRLSRCASEPPPLVEAGVGTSYRCWNPH